MGARCTSLGFAPLIAQTRGQRSALLSPSPWLATPNGGLSLLEYLGGEGARRTRAGIQVDLDSRGGAKRAPGHAPPTWVSMHRKAKVQSSGNHRGMEKGRERQQENNG